MICIALFLACPQTFKGSLGEVGKRIQRIESNLIPPVVIANRPLAMRSLRDGMQSDKVPGLSVAVINDGRVAWAKAYGVRKAGSDDPVTVTTLFQTASMGKTITATTALSLVAQGKISLDEDVNKRLVGWKIPDNELTTGSKITLRELLSHTSGINPLSASLYEPGTALPTLVQVLNGTPPAANQPITVVSKPGTAWSYSGGGYTIVEKLISDVSGTQFSDYVKTAVFDPLHLQRSFESHSMPDRWRSIAASGHDDEGKPLDHDWYDLAQLGPGGAWSNPTEFAKFVVALQDAYHGRPHALIPKQLAQEMMHPIMNGYGLGVFLKGEGKNKYFYHSGHNTGYKCIMVGFLETGQGAVILANSDTSAPVIFGLLRSIAKEYRWPAFQPTARTLANFSANPNLAGKYQLDGGPVLTISARNGKLFGLLPPVSNKEVELLPQSANEYFVLEDDVLFTFQLGADGVPTEILVAPNGDRPMHAKRIP